MSRAAVSEEYIDKCSHLVTRFHPVSPKAQSPDRSKTTTPPIPLALPQLLDAEKHITQETHAKPATSKDEDEENVTLHPAAQESARSASSQWPRKLQLVSSSTTTVEQSSSTAEAADRDEHNRKQSRNVVKSKIKDLLTSTERKTSGNTIELDYPSKPDAFSVQVKEMRGSVSDLDVMDPQHLPHLQAHSEELRQLYSTDGGQSLSQASKSATNKDETGTSSSKMLSRKPTFDHKFSFASDKRASSPVKTTPTTPVRGRTRGTHSPSGRPYSVDHRFALSPSRSNSRGSRGSLTFNIKARVSPGRKLGKKDDTELFVTANIESDDSDEGE